MKTLTTAMAALVALGMGAATLGCSSGTPRGDASPGAVEAAGAEECRFSGDSALSLAAWQLSFGPRVPGTAAHRAFGDALMGRLRALGADSVSLLTGPGIRNILARFRAAERPDSAPAILLLAHYDTRPWADSDPDPANHRTPIPGANDGASGVAVLLEMARLLGSRPAAVNVDLLFVDAEDGGSHSDDDSWCLGSRHFARNLPYAPDALPRKAVLLDMVGGTGAVFHREWLSSTYARSLTDELWSLAARLGMKSRFIDKEGQPVTDDHLPLLEAGIPAVDIIENNNPATGTFPPQWHTMYDNLDALSAATLADVGRLIETFTYKQK